MSLWHCREATALLKNQTKAAMVLLSMGMICVTNVLLKWEGLWLSAIAKVPPFLGDACFRLGHLGPPKPG